MKFYDRKNEIEKLREIERRSHKTAQFTVIPEFKVLSMGDM